MEGGGTVAASSRKSEETVDNDAKKHNTHPRVSTSKETKKKVVSADGAVRKKKSSALLASSGGESAGEGPVTPSTATAAGLLSGEKKRVKKSLATSSAADSVEKKRASTDEKNGKIVRRKSNLKNTGSKDSLSREGSPSGAKLDQFYVSLLGQRVEQFTMIKRLGKGGAAIVYLGIHEQTGEKAAIKQIPLDEKSLANMEDIMAEIDFMKKLDHPNIVRFKQHIQTKDNLFIVLEFVEKGSLSETLKQAGTLPEGLVAVFMKQVLEGLRYLHSLGFVHRDIKCDNLLVTSDNIIKLADFGVATTAKVKNAKSMMETLAAGGTEVVGTPYWMAPEVIEMRVPTTASDIWSVGCTTIECLTGKPPFFDLGPLSALFKIVESTTPPIPSGISEECRDFLIRCFKRKARERAAADDLLQHPFILKHSPSRAQQIQQDFFSKLAQKTAEAARAKSQSKTDSINSDEISQDDDDHSERDSLPLVDRTFWIVCIPIFGEPEFQAGHSSSPKDSDENSNVSQAPWRRLKRPIS